MDRSSLRILYWNPGGIRQKVQALQTLAQDQGIHIILLGETKLKPSMPLKLPNFETYRHDEVSPQGSAFRGTAALVRRDVIHDSLDHLPFTDIRTTGVKVQVTGQELKIFAGYRPPRARLCNEDLRHIFDGRTPTLLAADLNAKHREWGSNVINPAGRCLQAAAEALNLTVVGPDSPTHIPTNRHNRADVLDIAVHDRLPCPILVEVLYDMNEQHLPILITMAFGADMRIPRPAKLRVNWETYASKFTCADASSLNSAEDVERCTAEMTQAIKTAIAEASAPAPQSQRRPKMPPRLEALKAKKRRLHKLWTTNRCPRLKTALNALAEKLSAEVQKWRGEEWDARVDKAAQDPTKTSLFQLNRALTQAKSTVCPLLDSAGRCHYPAQERAELLADHLEDQFQLHPVPMDAAEDTLRHHQRVQSVVEEFLTAQTSPLPGEIFVTPAEVKKAARWLNTKKAPGDDGITNTAIKYLPARGLVAVARLYNGILRTQHFPETWKLGRIITLHKPGKDRRQPASYRPITLLDTLSKLFERLLLRRLLPHLQLREEQHGFRAGHSTTLQLTRVIHYMADEWNRGRRTVAVFLDVEKAFDRVWHEGLLLKLLSTTTPPALIRLVASFLSCRKFYVAVENTTSTTRNIAAGVPQGSSLSPALYGLYTDDIPTLDQDELREGERGVTLALYADDSAFFASSNRTEIAVGQVQRVLHKIPEWLDKWRMAVNVAKTQALLTGATRTYPPPMTLRNMNIKWESCVKYLGVHIDRTLRMRPQVDHAVHQAKAARALLRPVLTSKLPLRTKLGIYKSYVRSRLTYAAPAWYALCSAPQRKRLQVVQNVTLRHITGAGRYVRNDIIARDTGVPEVGEFVARLARRMFDRADNGPHPHLYNIAPLHARPPEAPQRRPLPRDILSENDDAQERRSASAEPP